MPRRRAIDGLYTLALLGLVLLFFVPLLVTHRFFLLRDLCILFYPGYVFLREMLTQGALPLWCPHASCGEPFLADIERGVYYLPNLLYLLLPTPKAVVTLSAFHVFLAAAGAFGLCRLWDLSRDAALLAGIAYGFNSYLITKIEFPSELASAAWFPWVLAAYVYCHGSPSLRRLLLLALAIAMQFYAGFPESLVFSMMALLIYGATIGVRRAMCTRSWRPVATPILLLIGAGCVALLLAAAQLLPTIEAFQQSMRSGETDPQAARESIHPLGLLCLLIPTLYGGQSAYGWYWGTYWAPSCFEYSIGALYLGIVPVAVALCLLARRLRRPKAVRDSHASPDHTPGPDRLALLLVAAFFFAYAMGDYTRLYAALSAVLPLLNHFVSPPKALLCVVLPLSCLTAVALDSLIRPSHDPSTSDVPRWRTALATWLPWSVFASLAVFMALCLVNDGALGKALLTRCFNVGSVDPRLAHRIPWHLLVRDAVRLPLVGLATVALLRLARRRPATTLVVRLLALLAFVDLAVTAYPDLQIADARFLTRPSPCAASLNPPDKTVRFLEFEDAFTASLRRPIFQSFPPFERTLTLPGQGTASSSRDIWQRVMHQARDLLYASWPMADRADKVRTSTSIFSPRPITELSAVLRNPEIASLAKRRLLALLNCDRVIVPVDLTEAFAENDLPPATLGILPDPLPRAFVVGSVKHLPDRRETLHALLSADDPLLARAYVDTMTSDIRPLAETPARAVPHRVQRLEAQPNRLTVELHAVEAGLLVVSESYYPGWTARVNGEPAVIHRTNYAFRGVAVPAGTSTVVMTFDPPLVRRGAAITGITLAAIVLLVLFLPRRRRPPTA